MSLLLEPVTPSENDSRLARASSKLLSSLIGARQVVKVALVEDDGSQKVVEVPASAFRLLEDILTHMARGSAVTLTPYHHLMTTQDAANYLNVSRPYLIKILNQGDIPFQMVGKHRRIKFSDIQAYKLQMEQTGKLSLARMDELAQEFGMDD